MKRQLTAAVIACVLSFSLSAQSVAADIKLPDLGQFASEAASGIADAAGKAGEAISETAGKAGEVITDAAGKTGQVLSNAARQTEALTSGFASQAGEVMSKWGKYAGDTADSIKQDLEEAGVSIRITAEELGKSTADKVSVLTDKAGKAADDAISVVSDAGDLVVDQAGHVVDMAEAGAEYVSDTAAEAFQILQEKGKELMGIAQKAIEGIDLSNEENWDKARIVVTGAIDQVYENGSLLGVVADRETVQTVTNIVFSTLMYGYQYANGQITLAEYACSMSDIIIREGLPLGVGLAVRLLPIYLPNADDIAKDAVTYLISLAFEDKPGGEIESEEELILEEAS